MTRTAEKTTCPAIEGGVFSASAPKLYTYKQYNFRLAGIMRDTQTHRQQGDIISLLFKIIRKVG
jgi:hypothetical protein